MTELLLGCGHSRQKRLALPNQKLEFTDLVTLDNNTDCNPDFVRDLNDRIWFHNRHFENNFTEVHAYEVLEHLGRQGDVASFFSTFDNIWRILQPGGHLFATVPSRFSCWLWGDPGHTRAILPETLIFLNQKSYAQCDSKTSPMSDYRSVYQSDFDIVYSNDDRTFHSFILQAIKPARIK